MDYNTMDYIPNGIIVSNVKESKILHINKLGKQILKITDNKQIKSLAQFITDDDEYKNLKIHVIEDNKKYGKSEGIAYLKTLDNTFVEVNFVCIAMVENPDIVHYIFSKAVEVVNENHISFRELSDELPKGIIVSEINDELSMIYVNDEHCKILNIDKNKNKNKNKNNKKHLLKDFIFYEDLNWVMEEIYAGFLSDEDINIEFRLRSNFKQPKWVHLYGHSATSENNEKLFHINLKMLSQRSYIDDKLHMERVIFHKITELTEDIIFRIDLKTNILYLLGNKNNTFGEIDVFENYETSLLKMHKVHTEDINVYKELIECFNKGVEKIVELRYLSSKGDFQWYKVTYSFIRNSSKEPISVIGKIININSQKILEEQARMDMLTNFYNKMTTAYEVNKLIRLKENQKHALFIVDIDNFKAINDNLGHHFGDMVLSDISNDIKNCFRTKDIFGHIGGRRVIGENTKTYIRQKDILGRIGGDEFIIVMRDIDDTDVVLEKAQILCSVLDRTFSNESNDNSYSISASLGISMYPEHGLSYEDLYQKADLALYDIKKTGKNGYKLYFDEIIKKHGNHISNHTDANNYKVMNINTMVVSSVLNLLYETKDLSTSITAILMYLGNIYKVDRCYIFNATNSDNSYADRYKWTRQGSIADLPDGIENKNLYSILNQTDNNGIFHTNDIYSINDDVIIDRLEREKVQSIFLIESQKEDSERLILGLEDCTNKRKWLESEVVTLLHIGRLIFTAVINNDNVIKSLKSKE